MVNPKKDSMLDPVIRHCAGSLLDLDQENEIFRGEKMPVVPDRKIGWTG